MQGYTLQECSAYFNIPFASIQNVINEHGYMRSTKRGSEKARRILSKNREKVLYLYISGYGVAYICNKYGVTNTRVVNFLRKENVYRRHGTANKKTSRSIRIKFKNKTVSKPDYYDSLDINKMTYLEYKTYAIKYVHYGANLSRRDKRELKEKGYRKYTYTGVWHIDHIFSMLDGYNSTPRVPFHILSHRKNLQYVPSIVNALKSSNSWISLKSLIRRIDSDEEL